MIYSFKSGLFTMVVLVVMLGKKKEKQKGEKTETFVVLHKQQFLNTPIHYSSRFYFH